MTVQEAILARRSVRAFRPDPVARDVLAGILSGALHTPSWADSQPWEIYVASGETLEAIRAEYARALYCPRPRRPGPAPAEGMAESLR